MGAPDLVAAVTAGLEKELEPLAMDPRRLKPAQLVQLLNSTPLGEVLTPAALARHRAAAGLRIGDGQTLDLIRYVAWLRRRRIEMAAALLPAAATAAPAPSDYDAHRDRMQRRMVVLSQSGRDISRENWVHPPFALERRARCARDFRIFCETYFPQTFYHAWSADHLKVIAKIELAVLEGGLFAMAMPRGSGKTSLCETACLWALLYGHRTFVALIGADEEHAEKMLESIMVELETNDLLEQDFAEAAGPIRALEGIHQRANGQIYQGRLTYIGWTVNEIVLPTLPPLPWAPFNNAVPSCCGTVIKGAGITGRIRGMKHKRIDGTPIRPELALIDDPQTRESASSPPQCTKRELTLSGDVLGLAGPGKKISGLLPMTVIYPDDLADRILDRQKHPVWQGERTKLVYDWPTNEKLWQQYADLRQQNQINGASPAEVSRLCHDFYEQHREAMDQGASVAWPDRRNPDELSALQNAMNLKIDRGEEAFFAEYQNEPRKEEAEDDLPTADQIMAKVNGYGRSRVPRPAAHLTMFVDVQQKALFWLIAAWEDDFTGYVIDYGTEPEQKTEYFTLREIRHTLTVAAPKAGLEGSIYAGLERLCARTLGREWPRDDGTLARIDRCLIDANWGQSTTVVYNFCRQSTFSGQAWPSHGRYVGASSRPFFEYQKKEGDRVGLNWRIPAGTGRRSVRHVVFDTNYWKSFVQTRLAVGLGDRGCLSLWGRKPDRHRLLADHLTAEYRVRTEGRGRTVDEWKLRLDGRDNHWLDGLVGSAVAASICGAGLPSLKTAPSKPKVRLSELLRQRGMVRR